MKTAAEVIINFARINAAPTRFKEGFVEDTGTRLVTFTIIPPEYTLSWSMRWVKAGMIPSDRKLFSVRKYLFYDRYFTILEYRDTEDRLLGYYCDVATPLKKQGPEYYINDLMLDLWIGANGTLIEFDWDEFDEACKQGQLSAEQRQIAVATFEWMKEKAKEGSFPGALIRI